MYYCQVNTRLYCYTLSLVKTIVINYKKTLKFELVYKTLPNKIHEHVFLISRTLTYYNKIKHILFLKLPPS